MKCAHAEFSADQKSYQFVYWLFACFCQPSFDELTFFGQQKSRVTEFFGQQKTQRALCSFFVRSWVNWKGQLEADFCGTLVSSNHEEKAIPFKS
jgi:hypothetical protein